MIWIIYKNELIKAYQRFAVWVTFLFFSFFVFMEYGSKYFQARGNPDGYLACRTNGLTSSRRMGKSRAYLRQCS